MQSDRTTRSREEWTALGLVLMCGAFALIVGLALWDAGRIMGKLFLLGGAVILMLIVYILRPPKE